MWSGVIGFFNWYWHSGLAVWVTVIFILPMVGWEVVKRIPNKNRRRRGKNAKSR